MYILYIFVHAYTYVCIFIYVCIVRFRSLQDRLAAHCTSQDGCIGLDEFLRMMCPQHYRLPQMDIDEIVQDISSKSALKAPSKAPLFIIVYIYIYIYQGAPGLIRIKTGLVFCGPGLFGLHL